MSRVCRSNSAFLLLCRFVCLFFFSGCFPACSDCTGALFVFGHVRVRSLSLPSCESPGAQETPDKAGGVSPIGRGEGSGRGGRREGKGGRAGEEGRERREEGGERRGWRLRR